MVHGKAGNRKIIAAAAIFAAIGIALLFFLSETPSKLSVGQALVTDENTAVILEGKAKNITDGKFLLCERLCISVRSEGVATAALLADGRQAVVQGRMKEYRGSRFVEAQAIDIEWQYEK
jgi:hypothetical protein